MEVATIFTSQHEAVSLFDRFLYSYSKIRFVGKDHDTAYFEEPKTGKNALYCHYKLNDIEYEFSYNYIDEDIKAIRNKYIGKIFYSFDLSFRSEEFLAMLMRDFIEFLIKERQEFIVDILISHPFNGVLPLDSYRRKERKSGRSFFLFNWLSG